MLVVLKFTDLASQTALLFLEIDDDDYIDID